MRGRCISGHGLIGDKRSPPGFKRSFRFGGMFLRSINREVDRCLVQLDSVLTGHCISGRLASRPMFEDARRLVLAMGV